MSQSQIPASYLRQIDSLKKRVADLERILRPFVKLFHPELVFSWGGPIVTGEVSPVFRARNFDRTVFEIHVELETAGSTSTVVEVYRNGVLKHTLTLPAGQDMTTLQVELLVTTEDRLKCKVATAGTGAEGLSVLMMWRPRHTAAA